MQFLCLSPLLWVCVVGEGGGWAPENARSFCSNLFFNRTPYQIIAHFRFVLSGHINPSLAFGYNLLIEVNRRSLPFSSHIYTPLTVRWSYLTIVYNRMIWRKFYWNSLNSRAVCQFSRFLPRRSPTFAQVWGGFKSEGERTCCPNKKIHVHEKFELETYTYDSYSWNLTYVQTLSLDIFAYHFIVQRPRVDILFDSQSTAHKNTFTVVWL